MVIGKVGLDGHEVGAKVVARGLAAAGMEVVYTGLRRTPEDLVATAIQEDADAIGISILSGAHLPILSRICHLRHQEGLDDVLLIVGGIIAEEDVIELEAAGVDKVFHPGTMISAIADYIQSNLRTQHA